MQELVRDLMDMQRRAALLESLERRRPIGARVYNAGNISINNVTVTALTFDSERYDTDSLHSTSVNTSRLTATLAGYYTISGHVSFESNATGIRSISIRRNGSALADAIAFQAMTAISGDSSVMSIATLWQLAAGDYVELYVFQNSGGALNVESLGMGSPEFAMHLLDPT